MPDICVDTEKVADCGRRVQGFSGRSAELNGMAGAASVPELSWGALGYLTTLYSHYDELLRDLQSHFDAMSEGFDTIGAKLRDTAQVYREADDTSAEHLASFLNEPRTGDSGGGAAGSHGRAPSNLGALGTSYANQWSASSMSGNLLSRSASSVPLVNGSYLLIKDSMQLSQDVRSGDAGHIGKDVTSVLSDMSSFVQDGITLAGAIQDPLNLLIKNGLAWLLNVVAPLKQAVDLVTGDPAATSKAATQFEDIAHRVEEVAQTYDDHLRTGLRSWSGAAGDAAAKKLSMFHDGINGTASLSGQVAALLQGSSMLMQAAEDVVKGILSDLVEWLVVTWVAAQIAAPETGGASEAVAAGATVVEEASAMSRATAEISKIRRLFDRIMDVLRKVRDALGNSKVGQIFSKNVHEGQAANLVPKTFGEKMKASSFKQFHQELGVVKSSRIGDPNKESVDPAKSAGVVGGHVDRARKLGDQLEESGKYDDDASGQNLDV